MTKEITLTQNKIAIVDDEDYERLNQHKWCVVKAGNLHYAVRNSPRGNGKQGTIRMHRELVNAKKGIQVDHRNGDGLDNSKENLRLATNQQNGFNQKKAHKNNKLGVKGVGWHKRAKKFQARIQINGKKIYLGCFTVLGDADSAYRIAEKKYFGVFARGIL